MSKVYIVIERPWEEPAEIHGVYSTRALAEAACKVHRSSRIEVRELDANRANLEREELLYEVTVDADGDEEAWQSCLDAVKPLHRNQFGEQKAVLWAKDEDDAIRKFKRLIRNKKSATKKGGKR
jgi:hypothetical protein